MKKSGEVKLFVNESLSTDLILVKNVEFRIAQKGLGNEHFFEHKDGA